MLFSELQKIIVKKVTFVDFRGAIAPIAPLDPPLHRRIGNICYIRLWLVTTVMQLCGTPMVEVGGITQKHVRLQATL